MSTILAQNDVGILVTGMKYAGNAGAAGVPARPASRRGRRPGAAGVPALTIPSGLDADGNPQGIILGGRLERSLASCLVAPAVR